MMYSVFLIISVIFFASTIAEVPKTFPSNFSFGVGTSAYQIEGSWDEDAKSENIWDYWIHTDLTRIYNNDTADVACDSYKTHISDTILATFVGIQHYSFSIPWTRILPSGFGDEINVKAIIHYQEVFRFLEIQNVTPVVTLYYHDLPQSLQDIGGWTNPDMVKYFVDYARVCFQFFPDVRYWLTFNDPSAICRKGYGDGSFAPGIASDGVAEYVCAYTVLKAHAAVYRMYKEEFGSLNAKMSIAIDMKWSEPASEKDSDAVDRRNAFEFGLYANPIYKGNWPAEVIHRIAYRSKYENLTRSRLPEFSKEEIENINGTFDFMAINMYYINVVEDTEEAEFNEPSYSKDLKANVSLNSSWTLAVNGQPIVPLSARKTLVWLSLTYDNPDIFITQNGVPDDDDYFDLTRINYYRYYLNAILDAIIEDGVNVIGYTAWSFYDCFEWTDGYRYKFGFYRVYSDSPKLKSSKQSLRFYSDIVTTFTIPQEITTSAPVTTTAPDSATRLAIFSVFILTMLWIIQLLF